jgi:zinc protease
MFRRRASLALALPLILGSGPLLARPDTGVPAEAQPAAPDWRADLTAALPVDSLVTIGKLDNGLTYYVRENGEPENRAEIWLIVDAGSNQEDDDQQGLAHFVEHMAFNGTENYPRQKLIDYLESTGMRFGPDINAYTSFEETVYMLKVPTDRPEILETGLEILREWAQGVSFEAGEVDKERGVVVEEWRLGLGAEARIRDKQFPVLFKDSRYAERLPIGKKEILEQAPVEALRRFYRDWYRPDLMAVVAVGDFDRRRVERLIVETFSELTNPPSERTREIYPVPDHDETLFAIVTDKEAPATILGIYYKLPRRPEGSANDYRRSLAEGLYFSMLNARLNEVSRQPDPPFLFAGADANNRFVRSKEVYLQLAAVKEDQVERGLEALLTEAERVDRHGFTETELERAKAEHLRAMERIWQERDHLDSGNYAAEYSRVFRYGEPTPGIAVELEMVREFLPTITVEELNGLVKDWISEKNRVVLLAAPDRFESTLPSEPELLAAFSSAEAREIAPYEDKVSDAPLLAELPETGGVRLERRLDGIDAVDWRLTNGVRVIVKPTDFRADQVLLSGFSPGGTSLVSDEDFVSASMATTLMEEGGLGEFDLVTLEKMLAGKAVRASPWVGELEEGVSAAASPEDLETMLQIVYLTFTAPRMDPIAFDTFVGRVRGMIENRDSRPETVFEDRLVETLSQGHFRRRPPDESFVRSLDLGTAYEVYLDRFSDASDFTFVIVGSVDPEQIKPLVGKYLGGLPSTRRKESWQDIGVESPESVERFEVFRGTEPKSEVRFVFTGPAEFSRRAVHEMASLEIVLSMRLREILREDLGGTYGVSVGGSVDSMPKDGYSLTIGFGCAPENARGLIDATLGEIQRIKREGVDESYVTKVKEQQRRKRETDLKDNGFWLAAIRNYLTNGWDPAEILAFDALVDELTPEVIRDAARRYLDEERYVLGVLYPEGWAERSQAEAVAAGH